MAALPNITTSAFAAKTSKRDYAVQNLLEFALAETNATIIGWFRHLAAEALERERRHSGGHV